MIRAALVLALLWMGAAEAREHVPARLMLSAEHLHQGAHHSPVLTLDQVLKAAVRSFPGMVAAEQRREAAAGERLAAEGGFDTNLKLMSRWSVAGLYENSNYDLLLEQPTEFGGASFFGGYRRGVGNYPVYEGKSATADGGEFRGGINIPLWRNGPIDRRRAALAQAELAQLIAGHDYDAAMLDLQRVVAQRYWDWVLAGRRVAVAKHLLAVAEQRNQGLKERIAAGDIPAIEAAENERAILERQERLVAAERMLEQTGIVLSLYWRDAHDEPQLPKPEQLPAGFPEPHAPELHDLEDAINEAHHRRPELRKLDHQRKQAEIERDLHLNQQAPGIDVSLIGAQDIGPTNNKLVNREEVYAGISIDLPLQRRVARGKTASAQANVQRIQADHRLASDRVAADVKDAFSALRAAQKRVGIARQQREAARQLEEGERTRFELGDSSLLFVNLRELASGDAALAEADALNAYHKAQADYRFALGHIDLPETGQRGL
jgi:outer membrane protein TolC